MKSLIALALFVLAFLYHQQQLDIVREETEAKHQVELSEATHKAYFNGRNHALIEAQEQCEGEKLISYNNGYFDAETKAAAHLEKAKREHDAAMQRQLVTHQRQLKDSIAAVRKETTIQCQLEHQQQLTDTLVVVNKYWERQLQQSVQRSLAKKAVHITSSEIGAVNLGRKILLVVAWIMLITVFTAAVQGILRRR